MYYKSILVNFVLNLRKMSEAIKITRGTLQGDDKFVALIEVLVDEGQQQIYLISL